MPPPPHSHFPPLPHHPSSDTDMDQQDEASLVTRLGRKRNNKDDKSNPEGRNKIRAVKVISTGSEQEIFHDADLGKQRKDKTETSTNKNYENQVHTDIDKDNPESKNEYITETSRDAELVVILQPVEKGKSLYLTNSLKVKRDLLAAVKNDKNIIRSKHLRKGGLIVVAANKLAYDALCAITEINGIPVTVNPPKSETSALGFISDVDPEITEEELIEAINERSPNKATFVKRSMNARKIMSNITITFEGKIMPKKVFIGMNAHTVRRYIPPPLQCYVCQRFGHGSKTCESESRCVHCAQTGHKPKDCPNREKDPVCANCGGKHPACANKCPARQVNKEIIKFKTNNNTTYQVAKSNVLPKGTSYAAALRKVQNSNASDHMRSHTQDEDFSERQQNQAPFHTHPQIRQNTANNEKTNQITCNCTHNNSVTEERLKAFISLFLNIFATNLLSEKSKLIKEGLENFFSVPSSSSKLPEKKPQEYE